ncbi:MAG: hypothetical protein KAT15_28550, partial [Bacteroidales bacterium]|nr:hypothetical protein [Bacteroidales bacterium]
TPEGKSGPIYQPGPSNNPQNGDVYFRNYGRAGFNIFRFSQDNCSFKQYENLDEYLLQEGRMTDELLVTARKYGFRIFYGIFGYQKVSSGSIDSTETMIKTRRFIKYSVARWGAYVDFWQLLNEQLALFDWSAIMHAHIRSLDPYNHPINPTWKIALAWNEIIDNPLWLENKEEFTGDFIDPHWYDKENELESDIAVVRHSIRWKRHDVPVVLGEQGNNGGVWDESSALRMRIRTWSAFFNEVAFIFWNTSYAKDGHYMNIWLGPQERQYVRVLQDFCYRLDKDIQMTSVEVSSPSSVRGFGLVSARHAGIYLHHFKNHIDPVKDLTIRYNAPQNTEGYWYSPEDASIMGLVKIEEGIQTLKVPDFTVDIALLITPDGPPDIDGDGKPNDKDLDNDNDGILDKNDAYPLDPEEWEDNDADRIGDNMDADDNADGIGDDDNKNGIPDHEEPDFDGDGFPKCNAVPWDAFPFDPEEWLDTDGDGIGNNLDLDDDGDGWSDKREKEKGTDPLNKLDFPINELPK